MNRRVVAVAYDGLCTFEFGVATELFGLPRPELDVPWYDFTAVSVDTGPIRTIGGITMTVSTDLALIEQAGTVVLPGWRNPDERPPDRLLEAIVVAADRGARIMSICSGVFILAATGLLDGHSATTHWRYTDQLKADYPKINVEPDVLFVDNGSTLTSAGSAAGLDLGLHLIRRDHGAEVANLVARRLVVPPLRSGGQAQFIREPVPTEADRSLAPAVTWMLESLDHVITVEEMAARANLSVRTFNRRFRDDMGMPPHQWLTRQRVVLARRLLETTDLSVDAVAGACGFGSAATLRHHFRRDARTTPTGYRASFTTDPKQHLA